MALRGVLSLALVLWVAALAAGSVTIRVRLPSGAVQRLALEDDEDATVESLRTKIAAKYSLPVDDGGALAIKGNRYGWSDSRGNATRLATLSLAPGEIVDVIGTTGSGGGGGGGGGTSAATARSRTGKSSTPASSSSSSGGGGGGGGGKKVASLAELQRQRKEMIKVTRQKAGGKRAVAVSSSVAGVLKRVSTGGVALLIGRSLVEPVPKTGGGGGGKTRVVSAGDDKGDESRRECIEVHAACEIFNGKAFPEDFGSSDQLISLGAVAEIAKRLGLGVVGCAIGHPGGSEGEGEQKAPMWSPLHIATAVQLRPLATGSSRFVVLCAAPDAEATGKGGGGVGKKLGGKGSVDGGKKMRRKGGGTAAAVRSATKGLSLEAFELSNQTATLLERSILPTSTQAPGIKSDGKKATVKGGKSRAATDKKMEQPKGEMLQLNSPVIIANGVEAAEIDPYLLAVPMPIVAIGTGSAPPPPPRKAKGGIVTAKTASSPPWRPAPLGISFEHSFPSAFELRNPALLKKASKHILQVLSARPPMVARMRDVQLLLHLSKVLDPATMQSLCEALAAPSVGSSSYSLPQSVLMAMDMAKLSLGSTDADEDL